MKDLILDNFSNIGSADYKLIILNNIAAILVSFFIIFIYKITYSGSSYSKRFNVSLGMLTIVTSLIMNVISSNIALSLGMVGALSIIRFRTAVKDVRDATFIFWGIAVGICCGVTQYLVAGIGSVTIAVFLLVMKQTTETNYLLIIRSLPHVQTRIEAAIEQYFSKPLLPKVKNTSQEFADIIYEVRYKQLAQSMKKTKSSITERLLIIEGVISVEQVENNNNINI